MADTEGTKDTKDYFLDVPARHDGFYLKGARGILRSTIPASFGNGVVMRSSGGPSTLKELSNERIAVDIDDAVRMNVSAMAVQVFIGGEFETQTVHNMTHLVDMGLRYGIPTPGGA